MHLCVCVCVYLVEKAVQMQWQEAQKQKGSWRMVWSSKVNKRKKSFYGEAALKILQLKSKLSPIA